jgi:hypothetical protein
MMKRLAVVASLGALLWAVAPAAYAEDDVDYFAHRDTISRGAGDANATNLATQTIDPWPPYAGNTDIKVDGKRAGLGMTRYQQNKLIDPRGLNATTNPGEGSNNNSGGGNGGASTTSN